MSLSSFLSRCGNSITKIAICCLAEGGGSYVCVIPIHNGLLVKLSISISYRPECLGGRVKMVVPSPLDGKIVLLTGGTDGIGRALLLKLIKNGATVTVVGRSREKWLETQRLLDEGAPVDFLCYDLALMQQVKAMADEFMFKRETLDFLVHSAGLTLSKRCITTEGVEEVFAVQFLARYYLNQILLPRLLVSRGKVVVVSAGGTVNDTKFDFENLQGEKYYSGVHALKHESIANDMQILQFATRHAEVYWYNYGPGVVRTNLMHDMGMLFLCLVHSVAFIIGIAPEKAAEDIMILLQSDKPSGLYVRDAQEMEPVGDRSATELQQKLFHISKQLVDKALSCDEDT